MSSYVIVTPKMLKVVLCGPQYQTKNEMGGACSTYGNQKCIQGFGGQEKRPRVRPRRRGENNINIHGLY